MTTDDRWTQLKEIAEQQLRFTDKALFPESFIEYECEPSFSPHFNLQLVWTDKSVRWRSAEWDILADRSQFYEPGGGVKVILLQPEPAITIQSGTAAPDLLADVIASIRQLRIAPRVDTLKRFTLDGAYHTLSLGTDNLRTTYQWHTMPDEWQELEDLTERLLDIRTLLQQT